MIYSIITLIILLLIIFIILFIISSFFNIIIMMGSMSISRTSIPQMMQSWLRQYPDCDYPEWMTSQSRASEGCIPGPWPRGLDTIHSGKRCLGLWPVEIDVVWDKWFRDKDVVSYDDMMSSYLLSVLKVYIVAMTGRNKVFLLNFNLNKPVLWYYNCNC